MSATTSRLDMYLAGGGSDGVLPDEPVDIGKQNGNFRLLDAAVGVDLATSGTHPATPFDGQLVRESDTGKLVVYNGATSQFVRADVGIPDTSGFGNIIKPGSIVPTGSGNTVTQQPNGRIDFTNVATLSLKNLWVSKYQNYFMRFALQFNTISTNLNIQWLDTSGNVITSNDCHYVLRQLNGVTETFFDSGNTNALSLSTVTGVIANGGLVTGEARFFAPGLVGDHHVYSENISAGALASFASSIMRGHHNPTTAVATTGLQFQASVGLMKGSMWFYGETDS